jgi:Holliday junction resolvasome RuvABC endonuclease subunit
MKVLSVDPSINSTGICVREGVLPPRYYIIASSDKYKTKKERKFLAGFSHDRLTIRQYDKSTYGGDATVDEYNIKEHRKTHNLLSIRDIFIGIMEDERPDVVVIEGISYGSTGSAALADLAALNHMFRTVITDFFVDFIVVSPTGNKKAAVGNGNATKDEMVFAWRQCDTLADELDGTPIMVDDIADAYFLSVLNGN